MTISRTMAAAAAGASVLALGAGAASAQTWTGAYIGGSVGYASERGDDGETILFDKDLNGTFNDTVTTGTGANAFSPGFCGGSASGNAPAAGCEDDEGGAEVALHAGYDRQFGSIVVGGVVELSSADVRDSVSAFSTTPASYTMTRELDSLLAARARVGYAAGMFLPYVTAGLARGEVEHSFATTNGVNSFPPRGDSEVSGHQFGAGVEARVSPRVSIGVEYLQTTLEDDDYRVRATGPAPATNPFIVTNPAGTDFRRSSDEFEFGTLRAKASLRF